jgi:membrane fusion protein, multidrug efflux system
MSACPGAAPRRAAPCDWRGRLAVASVALSLAACQPQNAGAPAAAAAAPPPEVGVVTVTPGAVGLTSELPGRLEASRVAQVRARVAGILQRREFREGAAVKAGQALFQIDAAPYRAALESAQAALARAQANLTQASAQAERFKPLLDANAISKQDYINAVAAHKQAEADVAAGRAALTSAQINLSYASVVAPISGRIGRALVTEGALVGQGEATPLAVIQQTHPMYVNLTQSTSELLRLRRAVDAGKLVRAPGNGSASVKLVLEDGTVYRHAGRLLFADLTVDETSGQVTLRAEVPNPDGLLLPGMYVRARFEQAQAADAILLPQQAVTRSPQGDSVWVVDADGKAAPRTVKVGTAQDGQWVILDGLHSGERVMVDGFQKLRGPMAVKAVPWPDAGRAGAPGAMASRAASAARQ